jgi:O-antigen/teichoic acid export membrane protein
MKSIAKVNIFGSIIGLLVSLPFYLIWQDKGIVPSLIGSSFLLFIISNFYLRKLKINFVKKNIKESYLIGKQTLKLGMMLSLSAILVSLVELTVKSFLSRKSGTEIVGLYQAGWTITTSYIGLVLTAMSTDFFPRLSTVINDKLQTKNVVTQQLEIALIILGPLITVMISFLPLVVSVLYSKEFLAIIPMTMIMLLGAIFKTVSWAISYVFLAKGDGNLFFFNELVINVVVVLTSLLFFNFWGLLGIGFAYSLNYLFYFLLVYYRANRVYDFSFTEGFWILFIKYSLVCILTYVALYYFGYNVHGYLIGVFLSVITISMSIKDINKRIGISILLKRISKKKDINDK